MFVCLCTGTTSHVVNEVVARGARTSREIAAACGAGGDCGRCRRTLRAMIEAHFAAIDSAPAPIDRSAPSGQDVVVQPCLPGLEHGVDIVGDLREPGELRAVLARRKVRMRAGETDKAASVDPAPFVANAERIARAAQLTGLIDTDMFLAEGGEPSVIDINPRFGGGYPFVHLAGADVPRYYLARALGLEIDEDWREYAPGVISAKHESVRVTATGG